MFLRKITLLFTFFLFIYPFANSQTITHYARTGVKTSLEIGWTADNHGTIQWQRSTDGGQIWTDIAGAVKPLYEFTAHADGMYRARIIQEKCEPVYITSVVKTIDFDVTLLTVSHNSAVFEISNATFKDARIVEYGFSYNLSELNSRSYMDMNRVKAGTEVPATGTFELTITDLYPGTSYNVRVYFITEDGSIIWGPGRIAVTLPGVKWLNEDWQISQTSVTARYHLPGFTSMTGNPSLHFKFGTSPDDVVPLVVTDHGNYQYSSLITGLSPNTTYFIQAELEVNGEWQTITKEIKTLPDYSDAEVDNTIIPVKYTIRWDKTQTLHRISPEGLQTEYPRIIRISPDTLLCSYHGGSGNDYWVNIYLQKSFDNGRTWTAPTILVDKEKSSIGNRYWRFANPEMIRLKNGWILMSFIGNGKPEINNNCHVMVMMSKDNGETWNDPIIIGRGRTWEPQIVQLPNGELELLVASEAAWWGTPNIYQEILVSRSTDNGLTWTQFKRAAYSPNRRDGMPAAIVMQGNKGILFSIETVNDQGFGSPSLVHRPLDGEWDATPWNGVVTDRRWKVNMNAHGGAPYLLQLPTGEIVVSAHVNGRNGIWQTSYPRIVVGDNTGHNFLTPVTPITTLPANQGAYYNSMFLKDEQTVWLVVTHSLYDGTTRVKGEIKYLEGKIVPVSQ